MDEQERIEMYLRALVVLQVAALERNEDGLRVELLLNRAGLPLNVIAELLGKNYAAVAKTISRERLAKRSRNSESED